MNNLDIYVIKHIQQLNRLEHVWFDIVLPNLENLNAIAKGISDREFDATYSEENAEKDSYYDARRIIEADWNFIATRDQMGNARQLTIYAFLIVLGQFVEQTLNDLVRYLQQNENGETLEFNKAVKQLEMLKVNLACIDSFKQIEVWQKAMNYLKHGTGRSSRDVKEFLEKHGYVFNDPDMGELADSNTQYRIPYLPFYDGQYFFSEANLKDYIQLIKFFLGELGK